MAEAPVESPGRKGLPADGLSVRGGEGPHYTQPRRGGGIYIIYLSTRCISSLSLYATGPGLSIYPPRTEPIRVLGSRCSPCQLSAGKQTDPLLHSVCGA